jgi:hypothetical protein
MTANPGIDKAGIAVSAAALASVSPFEAMSSAAAA